MHFPLLQEGVRGRYYCHSERNPMSFRAERGISPSFRRGEGEVAPFASA